MSAYYGPGDPRNEDGLMLPPYMPPSGGPLRSGVRPYTGPQLAGLRDTMQRAGGIGGLRSQFQQAQPQQVRGIIPGIDPGAIGQVFNGRPQPYMGPRPVGDTMHPANGLVLNQQPQQVQRNPMQGTGFPVHNFDYEGTGGPGQMQPGYAQRPSPPPPSFANAPRPQQFAAGPMSPIPSRFASQQQFSPGPQIGLRGQPDRMIQTPRGPELQSSLIGLSLPQQQPTQTESGDWGSSSPEELPTAGAGGAGGAGGAPTSWKMSIEPMAGGGMIPGYQEGGWLSRLADMRPSQQEWKEMESRTPLTGGTMLGNLSPVSILGGLSKLRGLASLFRGGRGGRAAISAGTPITNPARLLTPGASTASAVNQWRRPAAAAAAAAAALSTSHARDDLGVGGGDEIDLSILDQAIPKRDMSGSLVDTSMLDRDVSIPDHMVDMVEQARFEDMMGQSIPKRDMPASLVDTSMMDRDVSIPDYMVDMVQQARFEDMGGQSVAKRDMRDQLGTGLPPGARRLNSDPSQYDGIPIDMPDVHPLSYIENLIYDGPPSLTPNRRVNEVEAGQLPGDLRRQASELLEVRDSLSRPKEIYPFTGSGPRTGGLAELLRYGNQPGQGVRRAYGGIIGLAGGGYIPMYAQGGHIPGYGFGGFLRGLGKVVSKVAPVAMNFIPGLSGLSGLAKAGIGALAQGAGDLANDRDLNLDSMLGGAGRAYALSSGIDRVRDLDSLKGESLWGGLKKVLTDRDIGSEAMGEFANIPFGEATALAIAEQAGERGRQQQAAEEGGYEPGQANPMGVSGRIMPERIMPGRRTTASAVGVPSTGGSLQYADDMNYGTQTNADGGLISGYSAGGRFNEGMEEFLPDTMARWQDPKKKVNNRPPVPGYQSGGSFQERHPGLTYTSQGWQQDGKPVGAGDLPKEVQDLYNDQTGASTPYWKRWSMYNKNTAPKALAQHENWLAVTGQKGPAAQEAAAAQQKLWLETQGKEGFWPKQIDHPLKIKAAQYAAAPEETQVAMEREWEDKKDLTQTTQGRMDSFLFENFGTPIPDRAPNKEQVARTRQREDEERKRMALPYSERNTGPELSADEIRANVQSSGDQSDDYQSLLRKTRGTVAQVLGNPRQFPGLKEALEERYGDLDKFLKDNPAEALDMGEPGKAYVDFHDGRGPLTMEEAYPDGVPKYDPRLNPSSEPPPPEPTPPDSTEVPGPNVYPPSIGTEDPAGHWKPTRVMPGGDSATVPDGRLLTPGFDPNSNRIKQIHGPGGVEPSARDSKDMGSGFYGEKKWFDPNAADPAERDIGGFNPHDLPKTANEFAAAGDTAGANLLEHLNAPAAPLQNYLNPAPVPGSAEGGLIEQIPTEDIQKLVRAVQQIESPGSQQIIEVAIQDHGLEAVKRIITLIQEQGPMMAAGGVVPEYGIGGFLKKLGKVAAFGPTQLLPKKIRDPINKAVLKAAPIAANFLPIPGAGPLLSAGVGALAKGIEGKIDADRARDAVVSPSFMEQQQEGSPTQGFSGHFNPISAPGRVGPGRVMPGGVEGPDTNRYADDMTYGDIQFAARGGLINGGGGDAMADDIFVDAEMGSNGEKQTIAVSAGEYIIPGDVVGHLGSGATGGGANVLDQFVKDVRINRTGSPEQPGPIDLSDVLPGTYGERYA